MTPKDEPTDEATHARSLAARLRALDFAETDPPRGLRELESALDQLAAAREGAGGKADRLAAWSAIALSVEALGAALESEQRERAIDRMRLAEGLRWVARGTAEAERLTARVAELEGEVRARETAIAAASAESQRLAALATGFESERDAAREEVRARDAGIAGLETEIARLEAIAAQPGHRLVTRFGALLAAHPLLGRAVGAIVRGLNRLLNTPGK